MALVSASDAARGGRVSQGTIPGHATRRKPQYDTLSAMKANSTGASGLGKQNRILSDISEFFRAEIAGAVVLLAATIAALVIANSPLHVFFENLWHLEIGVDLGGQHLTQSLLHWIDDGLMALFFFVVGLEIKREFLVGELSSARKAILPIVGAIGGMIAPAIIYLALNRTGPGAAGWAVPMATDIAFALGVLALLGSRAPAGLKVFLTALAIADDLGAVLVIAVFYTGGVETTWLAAAGGLLVVLFALNRLRVDSPVPYATIGGLVWVAFLYSGVHATIAGVLVALTIPARARLQPLEFVEFARRKLDEIVERDVPDAHVLQDDSQQARAFELRTAARFSAAPLQRIEHALLPFTTYLVLPLFALANAGVRFVDSDPARLLTQPVAVGVLLGLMIGKPVGITAATWLAVRLKIADLPRGLGWRHVIGGGMVAGIGFTMSLFISGLSFEAGVLQAEAKLAILMTSVMAGAAGYLFLRFARSSRAAT